MSSSGLQIESTTLRATACRRRKSSRFVLAKLWFSVQNPKAATPSITYWDKPRPDGTFSALSSSSPMAKVSPSRPVL